MVAVSLLVALAGSAAAAAAAAAAASLRAPVATPAVDATANQGFAVLAEYMC